ncbi:hypothetical protein [Nemorincola caseinilytica]|uniref:hypothetical protein n=1 Tax=Nemorincola caseinilytica TaxID=2054315 RepID=UPI0031EE4424
MIYITSCTRPIPDDPWACNYVYCKNDGRCDSARCKCPVGYEGTDCGIAVTDKYIAHWRMHTVVWASDSANYVGAEKFYNIELATSASNTTFFLNNLDNNSYYNHIICRIDSLDNTHFKFDSTSSLNMYYDRYRIRGGWGNIYSRYSANDSLMGTLYIQRLNSTVNWQHDTVMFYAMKIK